MVERGVLTALTAVIALAAAGLAQKILAPVADELACLKTTVCVHAEDEE